MTPIASFANSYETLNVYPSGVEFFFSPNNRTENMWFPKWSIDHVETHRDDEQLVIWAGGKTGIYFGSDYDQPYAAIINMLSVA